MQLGSYEHRKLFCQMLVDRHVEHGELQWPQLDEEALQRLRDVPFWSTLVQRKRQFALIASAVAAQTKPTRLKGAIALQSEEAERQAQMLEKMMAFYEIPTVKVSARPLPGALTPVLMELAFEQYLDAFVLWGWFSLAREQHYFPEALLDIFDSLLQEDADHCIFFANWIAGQRFRPGNNVKRLRSLWQHGGQFVGLLDRFGRQVEDATLPKTASTTDIFVGQLTAKQLLNACIEAHDQRLDVPENLVKPHLAPQLAQWLLKFLQAWPQRQASVAS